MMHYSKSKLKWKHPLFDGVPKEVFLESIKERLSWIKDFGDPQIINIKEMIKHHSEIFVSNFYYYLEGMRSKTETAFTDACKKRVNEMQKLISSVIDLDAEFELYLVIKGSKVGIYDVSRLKYVGRKYTLCAIDEFENVVSIYQLDDNPKMYGRLHLCMLKTVQLMISLRDEEEEFDSISQLAQTIISIANIYNLCNYDDVAKNDYMRNLHEVLSQDCPTLEGEDEEIFSALWDQLRDDIKEGKLPYVKEFANALKRHRKFIDTPFQEEDYYYSLKSSCLRNPELFKWKKFNPSLLKSTVETNPWLDHPILDAIGYVNHYNVNVHPETKSQVTRYVCLDNTSKVKPRGAAISDNATQDIGRYIHRRVSAVDQSLPSCAVVYEKRGVDFARIVSHPEKRESDGYPTLVAMDYDSATDHLNIDRQREILDLIFPDRPEIGDWWATLSRSEKNVSFKGDKPLILQQNQGNPQGVLGSFPLLDITNVLVVMMALLLTEQTSTLVSTVARHRGDDMICHSGKFDVNWNEESGRRIKTYTIRGIVTPAWSWVEVLQRAARFLGFIMNEKKTKIVPPDKKSAQLDFANQGVLDGKHFSPIPTNLFAHIAEPKCEYYAWAALLWLNDHEYDVHEQIETYRIKLYGNNELLESLSRNFIYGAMTTSFSFLDDISKIDEDSYDKLALCYAVSKVRGSFVENLLPDHIRETLGVKEYNTDAWIEELPSNLDDYLGLIEDPNHKFVKAIERNIDISDAINSILGSKDCRCLLPALDLNVEEIQLIFSISEIYDSITANVNLVSMYHDSIRSIIIGLKSFDRFLSRSFYRRKAGELVIMKQSFTMFENLFLDN